MARLNGGKLLFKETFGLGDDNEYELNDEEFNAILEKGLKIKIKDDNLIYVYDVNFDTIIYDGGVAVELRKTLTRNEITYRIELLLSDKLLGVLED